MNPSDHARRTVARLFPESETAHQVNIERFLNTPGAVGTLDVLPDFLSALEASNVDPVGFMTRVINRLEGRL
jgi:hypothetical protein